MKDRLRKVIDYYNITTNNFSQKIGVSEGTIRKVMTQNTTLRSDTLDKISQNFADINIDWLVTGRGEMLRKNIIQSIDGNHNIQTAGDGNISVSHGDQEERISFLEDKVRFLTEQIKEKDNQINTLLSIIQNKS